jgi:hypothetical protein
VHRFQDDKFGLTWGSLLDIDNGHPSLPALDHGVPVSAYVIILLTRSQYLSSMCRAGLAPFVVISGGDGLAEPSHITLMRNRQFTRTQFILPM